MCLDHLRLTQNSIATEEQIQGEQPHNIEGNTSMRMYEPTHSATFFPLFQIENVLRLRLSLTYAYRQIHSFL